MEEILASIRRIISEDMVSPGEAASAPLDEEEDVLILRERAPAAPAVHDEPPAAEPLTHEVPADTVPVHAAPAAEPEPEPVVVEGMHAQPSEPETAAEPEPSDTAGQQVAVVPVRDNALAASTVALSAAASFERLYFVVDTPPPPPLAVSASGPTLEDLTREMLRPMIKAWLDENLDAIVRARVDEEVDRIARGRVR